MAELVDAHDSKSCDRKVVGVQISPEAHIHDEKILKESLAFFLSGDRRSLGRSTGFEPATTRTTIWRSTIELRPPFKQEEYIY